ncbi:MAG: hypothetical protein ACTTJ7_07860 [Treponema sp.]
MSFTLENGATISPGDTTDYTLTLTFEADNAANAASAKVRIKPTFQVKKSNQTPTFTHLKAQLTKPYFTKKEALNYILNKAKGNPNLIKAANGTTFASSLYAFVKTTDTPQVIVTPKNLFDDDLITPYKAAYNKPDGAYKMQNLSICLSGNDSINADDQNGTLTVNYMIASQEGAAGTKHPVCRFFFCSKRACHSALLTACYYHGLTTGLPACSIPGW